MFSKTWLNFVLIACFIGMLAGCAYLGNSNPTLSPLDQNVTSSYPTSTPMPTYTPTTAPLGSENNPIVMGLVAKSPTSEQLEALAQLTSDLSNHLQLIITAKTFPDYFSLEIGLQRNEVQLVWLSPVEYLLASEKQLASSLLITNHLGVTAYGIQFLAHRDGGFTSYYDSGTNTPTASYEVALPQFSGLKPCLTDENSLAGYWVPLGYLAQANIPTEEPIQTHSYSSSIRALYVKGVCSFAATYAISADPRTSSEVVVDLADVVERLPVIWISPAVIPNINLSVSAQIDLPLQVKISDYLRSYLYSEGSKTCLSEALQYEVAALQPFADGEYQNLREILLAAGVRLSELLTNE